MLSRSRFSSFRCREGDQKLIYDLVYHGIIYDINGLRRGTLAIGDGVIKRVLSTIDYSIKGETVIKNDKDYVIAFPGFIDMHVHLRDFNQKDKEKIETGTKALARGGITLACEMPNTTPPLNSVETINKRVEELDKRSLIDVLVFAGINNDFRENEIILMHERVIGFKVYPSTLYLIDSLPLKQLNKYNKVIVLHPEEPFMINKWFSVYDVDKRRPLDAEIWAVRHLGEKIEGTGVRAHITHITSALTMYEARRYGFSVDTCPHYFLLDSLIAKVKYCLAKVLPPIRDPSITAMLRMSVRSGALDAITSDHAPHTWYEKEGSPLTCSPGINAGELTVRLLSLVIGENIDLLYKYMVLGPTRILGLARYGAFIPGYRGNITIIDFSRKHLVRSLDLFTLNKYSIYDGYFLPCDIFATIVKGRIVYSMKDVEEKA